MQTATVFFSRFPDALTPDALPLPGLVPTLLSVPLEPDFISVHPHALEAGRFLVFEWARGRQLGEPINVASIANALCYVPEGFELVAAAPRDFGAIGCWKAVG
jgi:hypothetical protein